MIFCTNCGQQNDDAAHMCSKCGAALGASSGAASSTPPPPVVDAGAQQPWGSSWSAPQPGAMGHDMAAQPGGGGLYAVGQKRDPIMAIVFTFLTCGIYGIWWIYTYATEIKNALGREDLNPTMDLVLGIVTCGIYAIYAFYYKYPSLLVEMQRRVGLPVNDITMLTLILAFVFSPASLFLIQTELNKIWDAAATQR